MLEADMAVTPSTRSDAARNRERIITAASTCFASEGVECQMAQVAKRAGVGNATVFRHFPTKVDLIVAVMRRRMEDLAGEVEEAARHEDPAQALTAVLEAIGTVFVRDAALKQIAHQRFEGDQDLLICRDRIFACVTSLVDRAKATGAVRADLEATDVVLLLNGICHAIGPLEEQTPGVWRRYFSLVMDSMRPQQQGVDRLSPAAPSFADVERAYSG